MSRTHTRTRQRAPRRFVVPPPVSILEAGKLPRPALSRDAARVSGTVRASGVAGEPLVAVFGYHYTVDFGPDVRPRIHTVFKDRKCRCELSADCPAVQAVVDHLRTGGDRAPDSPPNYWETVPIECPICGESVTGDHTQNSRRNGCGWRCEADGAHFWEAKLGEAKAWFFRKWIIPPLYGPTGKALYAGVPRGAYRRVNRMPFGYLPETNR